MLAGVVHRKLDQKSVLLGSIVFRTTDIAEHRCTTQQGPSCLPLCPSPNTGICPPLFSNHSQPPAMSTAALEDTDYDLSSATERTPQRMSLSEQIQDMQLWLLKDAKDMGKVLTVLRSYIPRLVTYGIQVDRMLIGTFLIHAQLGAWSFRYESPDHYSEHQMEREWLMHLRRTVGDDAPFRQLELGAQKVRVKGTDGKIPSDVEYLFTERGYTDMYSLPVFHRKIFSLGITWATQHPDGFSEEQIQFLDATQPAFGCILQFLVNELATYSLLCTYLGSDPGTRVHKGSVYRGDAVSLRSVIWFSDIRGFTALSQELNRDGLIRLINQVFEITEDVLRKNGGEILKFIGDAVMAVFIENDDRRRHSIFDRTSEPSQELAAAIEAARREAELQESDDSDEVAASCASGMRKSSSTGSFADGGTLCEKARMAATEFQERLKDLRQERQQKGLPGPDVGVGLHVGECSYGNVGAPTRLDFTVIGPSVNLASRIEGLCSKLQSNVLASEDFVLRDPDANAWNYLGKHSVKGVEEPVAIHELVQQSDESTAATSLDEV